MVDVLSTGLSSLRSLQRALDTTSHNIANVATPGYTRQRVEFSARQPQMSGSGWIGTGVEASTVRRIYDQFLAQQTRTSGTNLARLDAFATQAERIDNLLGDSANGLSSALQSFTDAINEVSTTPSSIPARQVLIAEGRALAERLKSYDSRLRNMSTEINGRLSVEAQEMTTLAQGIAKLNGDISVAVQQSGQPPNDLLDQRDALINQLSGKVGVSIVAEGDSTLNVFIGNGQPLVLGNQASQITTTVDPLDPERTLLSLQTPGGAVDLTRVVSGGTLGGLLDWRSQMLDPARNELGRIGVAIASQVNAQHREGMDLTGALGGNFFNIGAATATPATANTGTAAVTVTRTNLGALTSNDYVLARTTTGYTLRRQDTGAAVSFTGTGTVADPIVADGLSIVVGAGIATGDQHVISPTRNALAGMSVAITDASRVAAAAPIRTSVTSTNTGTGTVTSGEVLDPTDAALLTTVDIDFTSATTYTVNGAGSFTYTPGSNIDVNGWRIQVNGAPAVGDRFTVRSNAGATGDNRNAFALADALRANVLDGGTKSASSTVEKLIADVGLSTRTAQVNRDAEAVIHDSDLAALDSVSGVNLDEEAANMLRYQQAYAAAAQIIAVANEMFDTLLNAVRR
ncbi:MAG TPA: flagellar hook-associated protein FlgK [Steroidobacteraceae bacterium]|nr:flagellar hook-associated protein FlgK [Steroidobacteraceae bacterium]